MKPKPSLPPLFSILMLTLMLSLQVSSLLHDHSDDAHPLTDGHICLHLNTTMAASPSPDFIPAAIGTSPAEQNHPGGRIYRQHFNAYFGRAPPAIA